MPVHLLPSQRGNQGWGEAGSNSFYVWVFFFSQREILGIMIEGLVHKQAPTAELHLVLGWDLNLHIVNRVLP